MDEKDDRADAPAADAVSAVLACVTNHPLHRELLYRTLVFCEEPRARADVEAFIASRPECAHALQEPFVLLRNLERAGGVAPMPVAPFPLRTTPAGTAATVLLDPRRRIEACLGEDPLRAGVLVAVLEYCREPRRLADVREHVARAFAGRLQTGAAGHELDATYFIDRLEEAGALVWKDRAWVATEDGVRYLSSR